uniref:Uncharacterized protein n=2 Tax=Aegilops tauschii subsp. strangulata TaxID=200361 RepID=A0A453EJJ3_AEGTS
MHQSNLYFKLRAAIRTIKLCTIFARQDSSGVVGPNLRKQACLLSYKSYDNRSYMRQFRFKLQCMICLDTTYVFDGAV